MHRRRLGVMQGTRYPTPLCALLHGGLSYDSGLPWQETCSALRVRRGKCKGPVQKPTRNLRSPDFSCICRFAPKSVHALKVLRNARDFVQFLIH